MDEPVIMGATIVPSKEDFCAALLGKDAKVSLIVYATVEIYELNQVMRRFKYRKQILQSPRYMKKLHKVDMWGKNDED
ncbi:hypothetical protein Goklo_012267 [Gossypium klotzschianum]|uniref:Uncharacterized protein n=2 Tax=Gossypium TaxID=3633 RepID=A0A7J8VBN5_9ROSI|nr:hypothetical protein [Gossypium klotzschianum]